MLLDQDIHFITERENLVRDLLLDDSTLLKRQFDHVTVFVFLKDSGLSD